MTELRPGTSPPPVRIPIRLVSAIAAHPTATAADESVAVRVPGQRAAGLTAGASAACMIAGMNYELFMGEALAEARNALALGERPIAAVAVVDEAMVARAHDRVQDASHHTARHAGVGPHEHS